MVVPHNIYIHVPFCIKKCNYCAFYSTVCSAPDWEDYKNQILSQINFWAGKIGRADVPTIFFGGGTPSLMPTKIFAEIIAALREKFNVAPDCEITIEANPGTLNAARLQEFIAAGVNRISIGVQSLNDEELKFLGRIHDAAAARELIAKAQGAGIRVSADFIYGLPGLSPGALAKGEQTIADVRAMCREINKLNLEHCSMYELSIEPGTPLARQNLRMPDNEICAQMYEAIGETLSLPRYEVSNYGTPCKHNANIWDGAPYIGMGQSAAGRVLIDGQWWETKSGCEGQMLSKRQRATEILMTGLRTARGVKLTPEIRDIIDWGAVELAISNEQLEIKDNRLSATKNGILLLDNLLVKLVK
ncbi:MAG: radical SAM family heme chaperone HemW [Alphaproteobacteria bacterium]|nr:radical SAM family heme chaperone HemW [Alphaproteobacteria bacterium]